ncbi:MAG: glycosyltransferase family 4 protein [bacterium]|nr:glycosyltransferase family 4 protein [bacterium]
MKIAHVVSTFPPKIGGMGSVCYEEAMLAKRHGHEPTVFTLNYGHEPIPEYAFPVVRLSAFPRLGDAGFVPRLFNRLKDFDLVHLHYPFYGGAEWVYLAKILKHKKYVVTYHMDAAPTDISKKIVRTVYDWILPKLILQNAEKIITVDAGHFSQSKFSSSISKDKIVEIANGVDLDIFKPAEVADPNQKKTVLFVGNLIPVKRLDILLAVMVNLTDAELLVVGGNYQEKYYKQMAIDLGVSDRVKFLGAIGNQEELAKYYNLADCVVIPSVAESFSLVAAEAMASGQIIVASDTPVFRHRIQDGQDGFLVTHGSVENFMDKIKMVLAMSETERKNISVAARKKAVANYSWEKHWSKLEQVYYAI